MGKWWSYWRRKGHVTKNRVERYRCLDCSSFYDKRCDGYPFKEGEEACIHGCWFKLFLSHALAGLPNVGTDYKYKTPIVATKCNYGGERHWFLCPVPTCNRQSKKLYFHQGGIFVCRKCLNLAYSTQNRSRLDRIIDKKWTLIRKLGGDSDCIMHKPKRIHRKTFDQIQDEIRRLDELAERGMIERFRNPYLI